MTSTQLEYPTRPFERRGRSRGERSAVPTSRARRTGMVSEAVVASYIRELAGHGRRVHGAAEPRADRPQEVGC
jgi:hypothetical protein